MINICLSAHYNDINAIFTCINTETNENLKKTFFFYKRNMQKYENMKFDENLNYDDECG